MAYTYEYPRPSVTVDCIIFGINDRTLEVLMIRRGHDPYKDFLALPGGFVNEDESLETAAKRELKEETGLDVSFLEQLYTFGEPERDPRGRVISVAYYTLLRTNECKNIKGGDDATEAMWMNIFDLVNKDSNPIAFDHKKIINIALNRLQSKVRYAPIGFNLLPKQFTMLQLRNLYETILLRPIDPGNFHKKISSMRILKEVGIQEDVKHRPAKLYEFDEITYNHLIQTGFNFEI